MKAREVTGDWSMSEISGGQASHQASHQASRERRNTNNQLNIANITNNNNHSLPPSLCYVNKHFPGLSASHGGNCLLLDFYFDKFSGNLNLNNVQKEYSMSVTYS